jgi:sirohydrochlorin ferrochelatase
MDWQRDVAVILAAHGDLRGDDPNRLLARHAESIAQGFRHASAGVLKGEPTLEQALAAAAESGASRLAVYPVFMSDGYFAAKVLPERVASAPTPPALAIEILPPLGLDHGLAPLIHEDALAAAGNAGLDPSATRLLIVGHGSELGPASANATRATARRVAALAGFATVTTAFLEEPPFLDAVLAECREPTVVVGFFSGDGLHSGEDVPLAIRETGARAHYAGSIGASSAIPGLIRAAIERHMGPT